MAQNNYPLMLRLIASSVTVADKAGKIIRDVMKRGDLGIVEKEGKNDLQTEADRSAQRCIVASLTQQFPNVAIIGEETIKNNEVPNDWLVTDVDTDILALKCPPEYVELKDKDFVVWVDPLDGTSEYTQGLVEHVTVLIGVAVRGKAVGGVIHQPYYSNSSGGKTAGRTMWGIVGLGIGGLTPQTPPSDKFIITTSRSHSTPLVQKTLDVLKPDEILAVGGAGNKVLMLIEGKAHAYVFASVGCKKWDTCAPEALLMAAGGNLTNIHGKSYEYHADVEHPNSGGVLATAKGVDHKSLVLKIPREALDALR